MLWSDECILLNDPETTRVQGLIVTLNSNQNSQYFSFSTSLGKHTSKTSMPKAIQFELAIFLYVNNLTINA